MLEIIFNLVHQEDDKIVELVHKYGAKKWSVIAQSLPGRIGKQCRERFCSTILIRCLMQFLVCFELRLTRFKNKSHYCNLVEIDGIIISIQILKRKRGLSKKNWPSFRLMKYMVISGLRLQSFYLEGDGSSFVPSAILLSCIYG